MQKVASTMTWGLIFGLVVFFIIARSGATPHPAKKAPIPAKAAKATKGVAAAKGAVAPKARTSVAPAKTKAPKASNERTLPPFLVGLTIFFLAIFVGFELISKVPMILHSPLMSGANAISGVTIVGALVCARTGDWSSITAWLGLCAVICAMINVVGGFLVTDRMLQMYIKKK